MSAREDVSRIHEVETSSNGAFSWVCACVFLVMGVWPIVRHGSTRICSLATSGIFLALTIGAPELLTSRNSLWQRAGNLMQRHVSQLVLAFLFYIVVAPTGMLMRLLSKSSLKWRRGGDVASYWVKRDPPGPKPDSLNNQF